MIAINLNLALSSLPPETVTALVDQLIRHAGTDSDTTHRLIRIEKEMLKMDQKLQDEIVKLQAAVANDTAVGTSAVTLLEGVGAQLATAIQTAKDAGASAEQLKALTDLETAIDQAYRVTLARSPTAPVRLEPLRRSTRRRTQAHETCRRLPARPNRLGTTSTARSTR